MSPDFIPGLPSPRAARAVRAACAVAEEHRLSFDHPVMLRDLSNVLVHLQPLPVVVRVATTTATVRKAASWLAREVSVAGFLARAGAPVVPPSELLPPGPHTFDGLHLSFWRFIETSSAPADPFKSGRALRHCHEALQDYREALPELGCLEEAGRILEGMASGAPFTVKELAGLTAVRRALRERIDQLKPRWQPLHGDAHLNNVLNSATQGPLWGDWEDTFSGPIGWDLGCLSVWARVLNREPDRVEAALRGYGATVDSGELEWALAARVFQAVAWSAVIGREHPEHAGRHGPLLDWLRRSAIWI